MSRRIEIRSLCRAAGVLALLIATASAWAGDQEPVVRATLPNGLRVVIVRNPLAPVVTTMLNYRVGSDETPAGFPGTAHALEHMMFRGAPGLTSEQLASLSAAIGGDNNADTQESVTQYYFTVPAEYLDVALHLEALRMRGVASTDALWAQERGAIEQEVADDLSNPTYVFYARLREAMFRGTPYAHDALGTRPSFDKTSATMLRNFHSQWYAPNNAILLIVGDVQPAAALASVQKLFGDIPARKLPRRPVGAFQTVEREQFNMSTDQPTGVAMMCFRFPGTDSQDYAAAQVLSDVLTSHRGRLYELVTEGKALDADFSYEAFRKAGLGYLEVAFPKGGDGVALLAAMKRVLIADLKNGFAEALVEAAKRHEVAAAEFAKNSVTGLAMAWSSAVAVEGRQSPDDDVRAIERVMVADVNRVARHYLDFERMITAVLTPQESGKSVSSQSFGGKESFASKESEAVQLPDWAAKDLQRLAVPASAVHPIVTTLPNGLRLIVQPETLNATVGVYGQVRNAPPLQTPPGQEGVDQVLDQLFPYGTRTLDRVAFQTALDDIGATASAGTSFSLQVLTNDFARGVQLLADNLLHPALPESAFAIVRKQVADTVAGELQSPDYLTQRALKLALLPADDPALRQATPATINALTLDDVRRFHQIVFRPDMTTIVVIGNVTPEQAQAVIAKAFGNWTTTGPKPQTDSPGVPANAPLATVVPDQSRVQCKVVLAETLGLTRSDPDFYALQLGNYVLGGAFYATRLYRDLRKDNGLVYYVESNFNIEKTRAVYTVEFGCDAPNVAKVRAIIERNLKDMQTKLVTDAELQQAKLQLLREIPLAESSTSRIASSLLARATRDLPLDEPIRAAHQYLALTAEQVRAAYAKWIRPEALVQVLEGPAPK